MLKKPNISAGMQKLRERRYRAWMNHPEESLWSMLKQEIAAYFRPPYEVISIVLINVGLALAAWFLINPDVVLKYTALVFLPIALASWAYADVPATNLFGSHAEQVVGILDQGKRLRRIMTVQNLALWLLVSPAGFVLSLALAPSQNEPLVSLAIGVATMVLPFVYLGLAAIMAPLLPFHPMPWKERLARKDTWLRYGLSVTIAYFGLTWPASIIALAPSGLVFTLVGDRPDHFLLAALLITPWCLFIWRLGLFISSRIAYRHRARLTAFLNNPQAG